MRGEIVRGACPGFGLNFIELKALLLCFSFIFFSLVAKLASSIEDASAMKLHTLTHHESMMTSNDFGVQRSRSLDSDD